MKSIYLKKKKKKEENKQSPLINSWIINIEAKFSTSKMEMSGRKNMENKRRKGLERAPVISDLEWMASECEKWKDLYPSLLKFEARQKNKSKKKYKENLVKIYKRGKRYIATPNRISGSPCPNEFSLAIA